jgi:DNA polymerase
MKDLFIDIETYSSTPIDNGVYEYAADPDFQVLLFGYSIDKEPVKVVDLAEGEKLSDELTAVLTDPKVLKHAHNAAFERVCLSRFLGMPVGTYLDPAQWRCTMVKCAYYGLPLKLENAGIALKIDRKKFADTGKKLIKKFCVPSGGGRPECYPEENPIEWETFKEYNVRDVEAEIDIDNALPDIRYEKLWDEYAADQRINDNGALIDTVLVSSLVKINEDIDAEHLRRFKELTYVDNPKSITQLKAWFAAKGYSMTSLDKKTVSDLSKTCKDPEVLEVLKLRQLTGKSSITKYTAMQNLIANAPDHRARGCFQFYGSHTGRWAGRHIQLQNLPRNYLEELDSARQLVRSGDRETLELLYDNLPQVFSELIRTAIIAPEGKTLIVADFSAIEARVIAWVAGEQWKLQAFKDGKDLYCSTASAMFGVPVKKGGINGELRAKGKIAELACIAEGSLVLTDKGLIPIEQVTTDMKLWDGEEWVEHEGVIDKGIREVITYEGLTATIDHLVWAEGEERPIYFGTAAALGLHLVQTGNGGKALRVGGDHQLGETVEQTQKSLLCSDTMHGLRCDPVADTGSSDKRKIEGLSSLLTAETSPGMVIQETDSGKAKMRKSKRQRLQKLRSKRYKVQLFKRDRSRAVSDKDLRATGQSFGDRQDRHQQGLRYRKPEICHAYHKLRKSTEMCAHKVRSEILALWAHNYDQKTLSRYDKSRDNRRCKKSSTGETEKLAFDIRQAKVYDIRNAGRHHRFTVSDHLVHNCGYGGSVGALKAFGAVEMGIPESELEGIVTSWREANPNIVNLWWAVGNAAIDLVEGKAKVRHVNAQIGMSFQKGKLLIRLPSGRLLVYPGAAIGENRFGGKSIIYEGVNSTTHQWDYIDTYGPRLVENIIQAIARDLLTEAILRIAKNPDCKIVAHVHDEIIIEADPDKVTLDDMIEAMCVLPDWGDGLILNAAGFTSPYYMKD